MKEGNIKDKISIITWERKVVSKHQHLDTVEAKIDIMNHEIKLFIEAFTPLFKKSLPFFWEEKGGIFSWKEYHDHLIKCKLDHRKFEFM